MKNIVYTTILASLIGTSVISVKVGDYRLSPFRFLIIILVGALLKELVTRKKPVTIGTIQEQPAILFLLIWLIYAIISGLWVRDYAAWLRAVNFIGLGFVAAVIMTRYLTTRYDILVAFRLMSGMILVHNLMGWFEVMTGHYFFLAQTNLLIYARKRHPVSSFGNTNDFAIFLLFSIFILSICLINSSKFILSKVFYVILLVSTLGLLYFTDSRASILGLLSGVLVLVYYLLKNRKHRWLYAGGFVGIIISLLIVLKQRPNNFRGLTKFVNFRPSEGVENIRITLLRNGFDFLKKTYGLGTGTGNVEYWMAHHAPFNTSGILNMHNWWMEILASYGIIIFILYLKCYYQVFKRTAAIYDQSTSRLDGSVCLGIVCMLGSFVLGSMGSSSLFSNEWLWIIGGIIISNQMISSTQVVDPEIKIDRSAI